jgi:hypothetical protein
MNIYHKTIDLRTGAASCSLSGFETKEILLAWIYINKRTHQNWGIKYEYIPNSCIKKLFGNDTFYNTRPWPK